MTDPHTQLLRDCYRWINATRSMPETAAKLSPEKRSSHLVREARDLLKRIEALTDEPERGTE